MKKLLILFVMLCGLFSSAQYTVIHVNSSWNTRHNVDLSGLKNAKVKYILLEDQTPSFKQQIKSVPTILVLDENGIVKYTEQVSEIVNEPNYKAALEALYD
jgi:hypothetical protein